MPDKVITESAENQNVEEITQCYLDLQRTVEPHKVTQQIRTLKLRVKDKHAKFLDRLAYDTNQIFNEANGQAKRLYQEFNKYKNFVPIPLAIKKSEIAIIMKKRDQYLNKESNKKKIKAFKEKRLKYLKENDIEDTHLYVNDAYFPNFSHEVMDKRIRGIRRLIGKGKLTKEDNVLHPFEYDQHKCVFGMIRYAGKIESKFLKPFVMVTNKNIEALKQYGIEVKPNNILKARDLTVSERTMGVIIKEHGIRIKQFNKQSLNFRLSRDAEKIRRKDVPEKDVQLFMNKNKAAIEKEIQTEINKITKKRQTRLKGDRIYVLSKHAVQRIRDRVKADFRRKARKHTTGYVPFNTRQLKYVKGKVIFLNKAFELFPNQGKERFNLINYDLNKCTGNFNEDTQGRWYLNITTEIEVLVSRGTNKIGIDLGLKDAANSYILKQGEDFNIEKNTKDIENALIFPRNKKYKILKKKLKKAQHLRKFDRVTKINAMIKNQRNNRQHNFTRELINTSALIVVGDLNSQFLIQGKAADSAHDAAHFMIKEQLKYKSEGTGVEFRLINEKNTTQLCSHCNKKSDASPKGAKDLGIREWTCSHCGAVHDRDINAAKNILKIGMQELVKN